MTLPRLLTTLLAIVVVIGDAPPPAAAQPTPAPADEAVVREIVERAQRHFELGEYPEAIEGFREAYRLDPRPGLFFNLGQAYRLQGDCVTAAFMYRSFLRLAPDSKHRPLAEQHLAAIAGCERTQLEAGARPTTVGEPEPAPEPAAEPEPAVVVTTEASPPSDRGRGRGLRLAGVATTATGAVALAIGSYFAIDAARASRQISDAYRDGGTWADLDAIDARGRRAELAGATLLTAGAVAVVTGATLYALGWRAGRHGVVAPNRGGAEVVVSWRF